MLMLREVGSGVGWGRGEAPVLGVKTLVCHSLPSLSPPWLLCRLALPPTLVSIQILPIQMSIVTSVSYGKEWKWVMLRWRVSTCKARRVEVGH